MPPAPQATAYVAGAGSRAVGGTLGGSPSSGLASPPADTLSDQHVPGCNVTDWLRNDDIDITLATMNAHLPPDELLADMKRAWAGQARFFSNAGKEEREHWVVTEFLVHLKVAFSAAELRSHPQASKVDVEFRTARFQVKEITDPNFRRGDEIRTTYERVMRAMSLQDTVGPGFVYDIPPPLSGNAVVRDTAADLAASATYRDDKAQLDLLCYVTRTRTSLIEADEVRRSEVAAIGWRSISCLIGRSGHRSVCSG